MLTYDLGKRGKTPLYQYLYRCIRDDILDGTIGAHEKLPSKRALASHLHTSVITVENAYQLLQIEGYVYSREKVGFFAEELRHRGRPGQGAPAAHYPRVSDEHAYYADFSSNKVQPSLFPVSVMAKLVREMIALEDPNFLNTIPYNGTPLFRHTIADYLQRFRGMDVDPAQVIVGCGVEYLYSRLMHLFPEGTVLGLEDPGNHKFADIAARSRIRAEYIPVDEEGMSLEALGRSDVNLLHLSPANSFPIGAVMPIRKRLDVLAWLYERDDRFLIEDDFDSEITSYGGMTMPMFHNDYQDRTIYLNSFAKTLLPSLRVAYLVLPLQLVQRYRDTLTFYSCTVSGSDQYVFSRFINDGYFERHLNHLRTFFKAERKTLIDEIERAGLNALGRLVVPPAGTHMMLELHELAISREQMQRNAEMLDIRFAFLSDYAAHPAPDMRRYLVLNYASIPPERLPEALARLKLCITKENVAPLP